MERKGLQVSAMPFVRFLLVYLLGVGFGYFIEPDGAVYLLVTRIASTSLIFFFILAILTRFEHFKLYKYISVSFYIFLIFLGWCLMWKQHPVIDESHFSNYDSDALIGYIDDEPKFTQSGVRFPLKITQAIQDGKGTETLGNLLVSIRMDSSVNLSDFQYGNQFIIPAKYSLVKPPYNPNEFDYQSYLADHQIWHQSNLKKEELLKIDWGKGGVLLAYALAFRREMVEKINRSLQNEDAKAIASALVLGYRNQLEQEVLNTFSITGTIHVLAVSGLHVGIVFVVFSSLLFWMKGRRWRFVKAIVLIFLIWLYALVTGLSPSVLRASIMISFGIVAFSFARKGNIYNTIAASAFFLLLYNPHYITEIGFKLSYLAVLGIVILYPKIYALIGLKSRILSGIWSYAALSIAAQLATFPLVLYYFHFFPLYFLPANVLIILPVSFVVYLGLLVLILPAGLLHSWVSWLLEHLIVAMKFVLNLFESLPYAKLNLWIQPWHYLLMYILLFGIICLFYFKQKRAVYVVFGSMALLLADRFVDRIKQESLEEIRIYNVYNNMGVGFFDKNGAVIYIDSLSKEGRRFQFSIAPNLEASVATSRITYLNEGDSFRGGNLLVQDNIIQFGQKSLLIYSEERTMSDVIAVDLLYIRNNPRIELSEIQKNVRFKKVLMDASSTDWYIKRMKESAEILGVPIYILKNNYAYVW